MNVSFDQAPTLSSSESSLLALEPFAALKADEAAALLVGSRTVSVPAGRSLMRKGEPAETIMILIEGQLRVGAVSPEGRAFTFRLVNPVGLVGEIGVLDGGPRSADVTSVTASRLLVLQRASCLHALPRYPAIARAMILLLCARLRDTSNGLEQVATHRLPTRLAALFLKLGAEYGQLLPDGGIRLPMRISQEEIGTLVAATREAVNKQLAQWREDAVLEIVGGRVELRQPAALEALLE